MDAQTERLKALIPYAIRAASAHNSQPWRFSVTSDSITIRPDMSRALPVGDPEHRLLYQSLGCALENLLVAGRAFGYEPVVALGHDIVVTFSPSQDQHHDQTSLETIKKRHTSRDGYTKEMPSKDFIAWLQSISTPTLTVHTITDQETKDALSEIVLAAEIDSMSTKEFRAELAGYLRPFNKKSPIGISVPPPIAWICKYINLGKLAKKPTEKILKTQTPVMLAITSQEDNIATWIMVGQLYQRIALKAAELAMATGPLSAAIVTKNHYQDLQKVLVTSLRPQFFARLGFEIKPTPVTLRLNAEAVMAS